jgi:wyosine [tRNA(Phe)-imidazoG37] synthetase (radical SAM superfamily)
VLKKTLEKVLQPENKKDWQHPLSQIEKLEDRYTSADDKPLNNPV